MAHQRDRSRWGGGWIGKRARRIGISSNGAFNSAQLRVTALIEQAINGL
jgi:hypothetical protein